MRSAHSSTAASEVVAATLRDRIVAGALMPGTPLREVSLAQEFGVSRNTFREALRQLATESLVDVRRHRGAVVRVMAVEDIRDLYRVRRVLELRAIDDGVRGGAVSLAPIAAAVDESEEAVAAGNWREAGTASLRFHQALVATLGSARLDAFFATIVAQTRLAFAAIAEEATFQREFIDRDREILGLLMAGSQATAAATLRQYLDDAEHLLTEVVRLHGVPTAEAQ